MTDMAREAGITKPILYRHFGSKAGLGGAIAERFAELLFAELATSGFSVDRPREWIAGAIDSYLRFAEKEAVIHHFLYRQASREAPEVRTALDGFCAQIAEQIAAILRVQLSAARLDTAPAEPWAHGTVGLVRAAAGWWLDTRSMPRQQLLDHLVTLVWKGYASVPSAGALEGYSRTTTDP